MAGESPGKSDQQKSSGETARGARDPRLTAFREGEADGGHAAVAVAEDASEPTPDESEAASAEAESESPEAGGDDGASGVRESESAEPEGAETESGLPVRPTDEAPSSKAASGGAGETDKPEGSDSRLREAVAAWVASDEPDADGEAEGGDDAEAASGAKGDAGAAGAASDDAASGVKGGSAASGGKGAGASRTEKAAEAEGEDADSDAKADALGEDADSGGKGAAGAEGDAASDDASSDGSVDRKTAVFRTADVAPDADGDEDRAKAASDAEATSDAESDDDAASGVKGGSAASGGKGAGASRTEKAAADVEGEDAESAAKGDALGDDADSGGKGDAGASGAEGEAASGDASSDGSVDRKTAVFRTADVAPDADGGEDRAKGASDAVSGGKGAGASRTEKAAADVEGEDAESAAKGDALGDDADSGGSDDAGALGAEGEAASGDASSDGPVDRKTAAFRTPKSDPDADRDNDAASGDGKGDSGASGDDKRSGGRRPAWAGADDDGSDGDDKPSGRSVDQKTAVFRAPKVDEDGKLVDRPTSAFGVLPEKKKGVDQPTTAIKALPSDADKGGKGTKRSEGENERTSKFVPLRSTDDPAPAQAKAPAKEPEKAKAPAKPGELPETERTKQQPLPPQTPDGKQPAPLDLLAELTNRPPKPETPIRTAVRRVKIWTPLVILLVVLLGVAQAVRPLPEPELKLTADASYAFKGEKLAMPWSGEGQSAAEVEGVGSLGTSGAQKAVPIASVTKVMTAYVVLKDHPLKAGAEGPRIKIDATAAEESGSSDESRASVKEGQSFTQHQLLQLLLINSSNNIARLLARWDAGSLDAFTKKMNDAAKSLGMKNTTYTDPSGLKETTKSTASDQLKLAKAAMQSEAFREVVATPNTQIPGLDGKIYNNNNLLVKPGVIGIKTGSSTPAGGALMWGAVRTIDGKKQRILGVVLEQRAPTTLDASLQLAQTESYKLITAAQDALTSATVIKKGDVVGQVDDGLGGTTPVVATKDLKAVGWAGLNVDIKIGDGGKTIPHTAKAGTVVGEVTVGSGPGRVKAPVALQNDLSEPSFGAKLTRIS
ncbi:D-alanyl-D-alanine carboxypeptidase [Streptomyces sp. RTd22]|uniref:D-alanyl-D-alanine carboxypeptidase n=1 Tax=Streptomyces sp. RTd22 TaxID=1841249 RepID=UPI0007C4C280|nr:D-alanyl-D-alanine carboxypeptidase [Streptomyces sp. RTd22]